MAAVPLFPSHRRAQRDRRGGPGSSQAPDGSSGAASCYKSRAASLPDAEEVALGRQRPVPRRTAGQATRRVRNRHPLFLDTVHPATEDEACAALPIRPFVIGLGTYSTFGHRRMSQPRSPSLGRGRVIAAESKRLWNREPCLSPSVEQLAGEELAGQRNLCFVCKASCRTPRKLGAQCCTDRNAGIRARFHPWITRWNRSCREPIRETWPSTPTEWTVVKCADFSTWLRPIGFAT